MARNLDGRLRRLKARTHPPMDEQIAAELDTWRATCPEDAGKSDGEIVCLALRRAGRGSLDFSRLSGEELDALEALVSKCTPATGDVRPEDP